MKQRIFPVLAAALASAVAGVTLAGHALATPTVGTVFNNVLSTGTVPKGFHTTAYVSLPTGWDGTNDGDDSWTGMAATNGPSNFIVQDVAFSPGGYTGWHNHPGILYLTLTEGSVEWYDAKCKKTLYQAGDSWTENTPLHYVRATGTVNARFMITYLVPKGQPKRIDQAAPACAAALGLN